MKLFNATLIACLSICCFGTVLTGCSPFQQNEEQQEEQSDNQDNEREEEQDSD